MKQEKKNPVFTVSLHALWWSGPGFEDATLLNMHVGARYVFFAK
jgi:hypothetical protein